MGSSKGGAGSRSRAGTGTGKGAASGAASSTAAAGVVAEVEDAEVEAAAEAAQAGAAAARAVLAEGAGGAEGGAGAGAEGASAEALDTVDALVQLSFLVQGTLARVAAEHDLSVIQVRLLGILRDRRPAMLELARHLGLDKSSMTGLVSRAEKKGLVERVPSPHDGRGVLVALTRAGRDLAEQGEAEITAALTSLTSPLSAPERAQLRRAAAKVVAAASAR